MDCGCAGSLRRAARSLQSPRKREGRPRATGGAFEAYPSMFWVLEMLLGDKTIESLVSSSLRSP